MNGLALAAALVLAQAPVGAEAPPGQVAADAPAPAREPASDPPVEGAPAPAPRPQRKVDLAPAPTDSLEPAAVTTAARRRAATRPATPSPTATATATPTPDAPFVLSVASPEATRSRRTTPTSTARPSDHEEAERAARTFLDALARGDASVLSTIAAERFSFDGDVQAGRESIRRTWRDLLAQRPEGPRAAVGTVELLDAEDAATRFGKPPARLAPLVRRGVTVAIADVGGRTVVLFLAREGSRMAVLGMHD